jgi:hypothetical protein
LQSLTIVPVGRYATPDRKQDDREHAHQSQGTERKRRAGQYIDVPVDADILHLRADDGDQGGAAQPTEIPVAQGTIGRLRQFGH